MLEILLEKARQKGMKFHPIICPGQRVKFEGEIKEHPEWLIRSKNGENWTDFNNTEAYINLLELERVKMKDVLK